MSSQKVKINESATKDEKIDQSLAFVHVSAEEIDWPSSHYSRSSEESVAADTHIQ